MKNRTKLVLILAGLGCCFSISNARQSLQVRNPVVAGLFYPKNAKELRRQIDLFLQNTSDPGFKGDLVALSVPHAGYVYSGQTAAAAYKLAANQEYDLVLLLAPSHREYFKGGSIYAGDAYATPLGTIAVHKDLAKKLTQACDLFKLSHKGHGLEHSLEVQIPFVQMLWPNARIIPIVIGDYDWSSCVKMGQAIAKVLQDHRVLLIASTDLYHGYSYSDCQKSDEATLNAMLRLDPEKLCEGFKAGSYQACGGAPVVILQVAVKERGHVTAQMAGRTNSNDVTGEKAGYVVGYGAMAYYQENSVNTARRSYSALPEHLQRVVIRMARESIEYYLKHGHQKKFFSDDKILHEKRGVFVTITKNGMLRGCIGYHESDRPLYELVPDRAVAAAFKDPRFSPLDPAELEEIKIKVSIYLTNVYPAKSIDEFVMGRHGIIMLKDGHGATYLPEVPLEAGWKSVDEVMESLCLKAGLPRHAWRQGAQFYLYETQIFDESVLLH